MPRAFGRLSAVGLAVLAAASAWVSLGTMAVVSSNTATRVAALPPLWWLGLLVALCGTGAWLARLPLARAWPLAIASLLWLPYVPGRVPAVFLTWQGPIEGLVWLVVGAGCVASGRWTVAPRLRILITAPRTAPWLAGVLAAACYAASAVGVYERLPGGDEPHYLIMAQSLLRDGDLQIGNNHERADYVPYFHNELKPHYMTRGTNGEIYSSHAPGPAVLSLPGFALFGYPGAMATVIAATATAAGLGWHAAFLLTGSAGAAWVGWAAVFLTAPFALQAFTVFPDGLGGLSVMAGVWLLIRLAAGARPRRLTLLVVGAALAALPWLHTRLALMAAAFAVIIGWRLVRDRPAAGRVVVLFSIPCLSAVAWFAFFRIVWGTFDPAVPIGDELHTAWRSVGHGLTGLLLDQRFGLLPAAPVYVCAVIGMGRLGLRRPRIAAELALVVVPYTLLVASYEVWWGGFAGPSRYLGAILPMAVLPVAWLWSVARAPGRAWLLLLVLLSVAMLVLRIVVDGGAMAYAEKSGTDALIDWIARSVDLPATLPTVSAPATWADVSVWTLALIFAWAVPGWIWRKRIPNCEQAWVTVAASAAVALMAASTAIWSSHQHPGVAPSKSQLAFVNDWRPDWQTFSIRWRRPNIVSSMGLLHQLDVVIPRLQSSVAYPALSSVTAPVVGAGEYEVVVGGETPLRGTLEVAVGDTALASDRWRLQDLAPGQRSLPLRLPVAVKALTVRGDLEASQSLPALSLHLRARIRGLWRTSAARRAVRYGSLRVFFLDDHAYPEPAGFWTVGESTATMVLDRDEPGLRDSFSVVLQSGPVPTSAELMAGTWTRRLTLTAHQRIELEIPIATLGEQPLSIRTGPMFLPVQHDPANRDFRHLGLFVEIR